MWGATGGELLVKDRIVQTALKLVIEPIFEQEFEESSYGFRPRRSVKEALREVDALIKEGYTHVVDADLESFFDTIPHQVLRGRVEERISDGAVHKLIELFLSQDIIEELKRWTPVGGTPQGAVISPLWPIFIFTLWTAICERRVTAWCATPMTLWCCAR